MVLTLNSERLILAYDEDGLLISFWAARNLNSTDQKKRCLLFLRLHHLSVIRKEFSVEVSKVICIGRLAMVQVFMLHYWRQVCSSHAMRYA